MAGDKFFQDRLKALEEIRDMGVEPYAYRFDITHSTKEVLDKYTDIDETKSKETVAVAGRIVLLRKMGKAAFTHIQDFTGRLQLYIRRDDVGDKAFSLFKKVQVGDIVEVMTSKSSSGPGQDWLAIAKTSRARSKIRQWFSKESREDSGERGRESLQRALRKQGANLKDLAYVSALDEVAKEMNFSKTETMIAAVGAAKISAKQVASKVIKVLNQGDEEEIDEAELLSRTAVEPRTPVGKTGVKVKGVDDVMVRLAHCCHPVPGDPVIGFIIRGRGLSVHRTDCSNAKALRATPERILDVYWDKDQQSAYQVEIQVEAMDRTKLLSDISTVLSDSGVNILTASVSTRKDRLAVFRFVFEIGNLENLTNVVRRVKQIQDVFDAYRVLPHQSPSAAK